MALDSSSLTFIPTPNRQTFAHFALPKLYSIHQNLRYRLGEHVALWRTLLLSASDAEGRDGKKLTCFPYCLWISSLPLGNLANLLEDVYSLPRSLRQSVKRVLSGPGLEFLKPGKWREGFLSEVVAEAAGRIVGRITEAAREDKVPAAVVSLELPSLLAGKLKTWVGGFARLKSLAMYDGSALDGEIGTVIRYVVPVCVMFRRAWLTRLTGRQTGLSRVQRGQLLLLLRSRGGRESGRVHHQSG